MEAKRAALVARVVILAMTGCHAPAPGTNVDAPTIDAGVVKTVTADGLQRLFTHARPNEQGGENVLGRLKTVATEMCRKQGLGAHVLQTSWGTPTFSGPLEADLEFKCEGSLPEPAPAPPVVGEPTVQQIEEFNRLGAQIAQLRADFLARCPTPEPSCRDAATKHLADLDARLAKLSGVYSLDGLEQRRSILGAYGERISQGWAPPEPTHPISPANATASPGQGNTQDQGAPSGVRVLVSFNSEGGGPDAQSEERMNAYLAEQVRAQGHAIERKIHRWGREGEFNACFALTDMDAAGQAHFVSGLRAALGDTSRAVVKENERCSQR